MTLFASYDEGLLLLIQSLSVISKLHLCEANIENHFPKVNRAALGMLAVSRNFPLLAHGTTLSLVSWPKVFVTVITGLHNLE